MSTPKFIGCNTPEQDARLIETIELLKVKPCPYCMLRSDKPDKERLKIYKIEFIHTYTPSYAVTCLNCVSRGPQYVDKDTAITAWNQLSAIVSTDLDGRTL